MERLMGMLYDWARFNRLVMLFDSALLSVCVILLLLLLQAVA